jgi:ketosteroid isomerase-like protein
MNTPSEYPKTSVLSRMENAINAHDIEAFVDCFAADFVSEQPAHPERAFTGSEKVRQNWTELFASVPDLRARLVAAAESDDIAWAEWQWQGKRSSGENLDMRGVTVCGVDAGKIIWSRLYMEPVQSALAQPGKPNAA